jgi:two-component system response regulator
MKQPFVVLMAEDDEHDVIATRRSWKIHKIHNPLHVVPNGEECLDYLYRRGKYEDPATSPRPGLILLDINLPRLDGISVLRTIREDEKLRFLPVVILTTSRNDEEKIESYRLGVNAYITKPVGFEGFNDAMRKINLFWELVELPEGV